MRLPTRLVTLGAILALALLGAGAQVAAAGGPIKPNQHFTGLVNGSNASPVVYTVCAGPGWPGRTGPIAGGQTMSVAHTPKGQGDTGPFAEVFAWFVQDLSGTAPQMLTFSRYGVPQPTPLGARVPCDGPGQAQFSSCPYGAPCASGFVPDLVDVTFVNIAD